MSSNDDDKEEKGNSFSESLKFDITLSTEEWQKIHISDDGVSYRGRDRYSKEKSYYILKPGLWTALVNEHVYKATSKLMRCSLTFKRCKIYPNGTTYLKIEGHCKSCDSHLRGM